MDEITRVTPAAPIIHVGRANIQNNTGPPAPSLSEQMNTFCAATGRTSGEGRTPPRNHAGVGRVRQGQGEQQARGGRTSRAAARPKFIPPAWPHLAPFSAYRLYAV